MSVIIAEVSNYLNGFFIFCGYENVLIFIPCVFAAINIITFFSCISFRKVRNGRKIWLLFIDFSGFIISFYLAISEFYYQATIFYGIQTIMLYASITFFSLSVLSGGVLIVCKLIPPVSKEEKKLIGRILNREISNENKQLFTSDKKTVEYKTEIKNPFSKVVNIPYEKSFGVPFQSDKNYINTRRVAEIINKLRRYDLSYEEKRDADSLEYLISKYSCRLPTDSEKKEFNEMLLSLVKCMAKYNVA